MRYCVIMLLAIGIIGVSNAEPIPGYLNAMVPPNQITSTDELGNNITPKFVNQTVYFHFNLTNGVEAPLDTDIQQLVLSDDGQVLVNKTDRVDLGSGDWSVVSWKFTPEKAGNYMANVVVDGFPPLKDIAHSFVITDPQRKYETATILIADPSTKNNCDRECFMPSSVSVRPETIVTWENKASAYHVVSTGILDEDPVLGTVGASYDGRFQSPMLGRNETFSFLFLKPGRYDYFSWYHPDIKGTIQVTSTPQNDTYASSQRPDHDKIEFFDSKPFFVSREYKITHNSDDILSFHGVKFTNPAFPDPPPPGGGVFTEITFQDGTKETLSEVGLLKNPILFTKHVYPQAGMRENPYDTFSVLVSADLTKIPPLKQIKTGTQPHNVLCSSELELAQKKDDRISACVKLETKIELIVRGWAQDDRVLLGCIGERVSQCYPNDPKEYRNKLYDYYFGKDNLPSSGDYNFTALRTINGCTDKPWICYGELGNGTKIRVSCDYPIHGCGVKSFDNHTGDRK